MISDEYLRSSFCLTKKEAKESFNALSEIGIQEEPLSVAWGASCNCLVYGKHVIKIIDSNYKYAKFLSYMWESFKNPYVPETIILIERDSFFIVKQVKCLLKGGERREEINRIFNAAERYMTENLYKRENKYLIQFFKELETYFGYFCRVDDRLNNFGYVGKQIKLFDAFHI